MWSNYKSLRFPLVHLLHMAGSYLAVTLSSIAFVLCYSNVAAALLMNNVPEQIIYSTSYINKVTLC
jgi:hypothetical protein